MWSDLDSLIPGRDVEEEELLPDGGLIGVDVLSSGLPWCFFMVAVDVCIPYKIILC